MFPTSILYIPLSAAFLVVMVPGCRWPSNKSWVPGVGVVILPSLGNVHLRCDPVWLRMQSTLHGIMPLACMLSTDMLV